MEQELIFFFDEEGDVLDISIGNPKEAVTEDVAEDVFVRIDPKSKKIVGFMILNFQKGFLKQLKLGKPLKTKVSFKKI